MSTVIDVAPDHHADIEIEWGSVSIDVGADHHADIEFDVLSGDYYSSSMTQREIVYSYVPFDTIGTHQATYDPTSAVQYGGVLSYVVALVQNPGGWDLADGLIPSLPGSGITLTRFCDVRNDGFPYNYQDGQSAIYYYIGAIPSGVLTMQLVKSDRPLTTDGGRAYFFFGTTFGTPALLGGFVRGSHPTAPSPGTNNAFDSGPLVALPFTTRGGLNPVEDVDAYTSLVATWPGWRDGSPYAHHGGTHLPQYLDNTLVGPFTLSNGAEGTSAGIVFTDSLLEPEGAQGEFTGEIDISVLPSHHADMEVIVEGTKPK